MSYAYTNDRNIVEPIDLINFKNTIIPGTKKYIRLHDQDYPANLFETDTKITSLLDMTPFGYQGSSGTVICQSSLLPDVTQAINLYTQEYSE